MSRKLRRASSTRADGGVPTDWTIERACALGSDTTNGISSVKIERMTLDAELERLLRIVAGRPRVRLVLRSDPSTQGTDLVIEQAIAPIHHEAPRLSECSGLLAHLVPRRRSRPNRSHPASPADITTSPVKEMP